MDKKLKVLLVTHIYPASDRRSWSGISFSIKKELEKEFIVEDYCINARASFKALLKTYYYRKIDKSFITIHLLKALAKAESKKVDKIAREKQCDCIMVMGSLACAPIAFSKSDIPKIHFSDCVISQAYDYYWSNVSKRARQEMDDVQLRALNNSFAIVETSDWGKDGAINYYGVNPDKISVFPMGANIEVDEFKKEPHEGIQLLFNGVNWKRKGADLAIECVDILNKLDSASHYTLHLVGCNPPRQIDSPYVKFYGFLNRNDKEERELLDHLREIADFFILPTRAECAGIVFCEACAYGIPSITFDTGGIGNYVKNDINGYRMPVGSSAEDFANKIIEYAHNPEKVNEMKVNARRMYETELNWETTGNKLRKLTNQVILNKKLSDGK